MFMIPYPDYSLAASHPSNKAKHCLCRYTHHKKLVISTARKKYQVRYKYCDRRFRHSDAAGLSLYCRAVAVRVVSDQELHDGKYCSFPRRVLANNNLHFDSSAF